MERLYQNLDVEGFFWLPDRNDISLKGVLKGNTMRGFHLEIQGQLRPHQEIIHREPIIYGKSITGHKLTLVNGQTKGAMNGLYRNVERYELLKVYVGEWLEFEGETLFDSFSFTLPNVTTWLKGVLKYGNQIDLGEIKIDGDSYDISVNMKKDVEIHLTSKAKKTFLDFHKGFKPIQDFFTIILRTPTLPSKFHGEINGKTVLCLPRRTDLYSVNLYREESTAQIFSAKKVIRDLDFLLRKWISIYFENKDVLLPLIESYSVLQAKEKHLLTLESLSKLMDRKPKKTGLFSKTGIVPLTKEKASEYVLPYAKASTETAPRERHHLGEFIDFKESSLKELQSHFEKINKVDFLTDEHDKYLFEMKQIQWFLEFFILEEILEYAEEKDHLITYCFANAYAKERLLP